MFSILSCLFKMRFLNKRTLQLIPWFLGDTTQSVLSKMPRVKSCTICQLISFNISPSKISPFCHCLQSDELRHGRRSSSLLFLLNASKSLRFFQEILPYRTEAQISLTFSSHSSSRGSMLRFPDFRSTTFRRKRKLEALDRCQVQPIRRIDQSSGFGEV